MSSTFIIPAYAETNANLEEAHFPLDRGLELQGNFARVFSRHLGLIRRGQRFEAKGLLVTGPSGAGKTTEIEDMLKRFNKEAIPLPDGRSAKFAGCFLTAKGSWKDLGSTTLKALGYPITDKTRRTQFEIWNLVVEQAKLQGVIGIHFDEAQHILRGRSEKEMLIILDAFKTLMKSQDWPLMLVLSGVPELDDYVRCERQLDRLLNRVQFHDIDLDSATEEPASDYQVLNEIVGSYAIRARLKLSDYLLTGDFLHRLATAGAFQWGLVIQLVLGAMAAAGDRGSEEVDVDDFIEAWRQKQKTKTNQLATPFTHESYERMYRRDRPFRAAIEA